MRGRIGFLLGCTVLLAGCADRLPTIVAAQTALQAAITGPGASQLKLIDFKMDDGQTREIMGSTLYIIYFSGTIEVLDDVLYRPSFRGIHAQRSGPTLDDIGRLSSAEAWYNSTVAGLKKLQRGDYLELEGSVSYDKKDSGWVMKNVLCNTTRRPSQPSASRRQPER